MSTAGQKPYCFVLMPFGEKSDQSGTIDFDAVFHQIIEPAAEAADLTPIRSDQEELNGIIHKAMFERLMLCDYAIADLTTTNPNVLYELGIRHGIRPHSTVLIYNKRSKLPFNVSLLRAHPYRLDTNGRPAAPETDSQLLKEQLNECRNPANDSPVFQLIQDMKPPDIAHLKTDTFRDRVAYSQRMKRKLEDARHEGAEAVRRMEDAINIADDDPAVVIDLFLSYRAVEDWDHMIKLAHNMPSFLSQSVMVQEQLGFALNRLGRHEDAEENLRTIIDEHGPSPETNGLLGRVYKDLWRKAVTEGNTTKAVGYLHKARDTYLQGFEADWRDAYPGINALTMMELLDQEDSRKSELFPVVRYAVNRRLATKEPDYWDYATCIELDVLQSDQVSAHGSLERALTEVRESWEPKSTADNLSYIREARNGRGQSVDWISEIENELRKAASDM